jgi:hypothetical protein
MIKCTTLKTVTLHSFFPAVLFEVMNMALFINELEENLPPINNINLKIAVKYCRWQYHAGETMPRAIYITQKKFRVKRKTLQRELGRIATLYHRYHADKKKHQNMSLLFCPV